MRPWVWVKWMFELGRLGKGGGGGGVMAMMVSIRDGGAGDPRPGLRRRIMYRSEKPQKSSQFARSSSIIILKFQV